MLYFDLSSGISGDMFIGAMLDLGVELEHLKNELKKLNLEKEYEISSKKILKSGISATKFNVTYKDSTNERNFKDIEKIINSSTLSDFVKKKSTEIFKDIAIAEGKVHNIPFDKVHFHEIGAIDSIIDIVGAAICLEAINISDVHASKIELGAGIVKCAHGILNVPAPATCQIVKNIPISMGRANCELTTPTGAAIIKNICKSFNEIKNLTIERIGYGAGSKELNFPNALRVFICGKDKNTLTQTIIETNLDDMSAENIAFTCEKLLESGALDVFSSAIYTKKSRVATKITILCNNEDSSKMKDILFEHTTSIGTREYKITKTQLPRKITKITTKFGQIDIKISEFGQSYKIKPEFDQCRNLAIKYGLPITKIQDEAINEYKKLNNTKK